MTKRLLVLISLVLLTCSTFSTGPARAEVIWDGAATNGTGVFGHIGSNCAPPGSVTAVDDPDYGTVWRYAGRSSSKSSTVTT